MWECEYVTTCYNRHYLYTPNIWCAGALEVMKPKNVAFLPKENRIVVDEKLLDVQSKKDGIFWEFFPKLLENYQEIFGMPNAS